MLDDGDLRGAVIREGLAAAAAYTPEVFLRRLEAIYEKTLRG
jgi:1,2-diacylglycerol 3-alpha-glucosyltransferase